MKVLGLHRTRNVEGPESTVELETPTTLTLSPERDRTDITLHRSTPTIFTFITTQDYTNKQDPRLPLLDLRL